MKPTLRCQAGVLLISLAFLVACTTSPDELQVVGLETAAPVSAPDAAGKGFYSSLPFMPALPSPGGDPIQPTPDPPHTIPTLRAGPLDYTVKAGDSLRSIAARFAVSMEALVKANQLTNPDLIQPGQSLRIPAPETPSSAPGDKILPDSELVYGPVSAAFDLPAFVEQSGGALKDYRETVDGVSMDAAAILEYVAVRYSVNPRLLLALLEYRNGWLSRAEQPAQVQEFPMGYQNPARPGLYRQAAWAADSLNRGYYLWQVNGISSWVLADGSVLPASPRINPGTAGVQHVLSDLYGREDFLRAVSPGGLLETYRRLFGDPFALGIEPLAPADLRQPALQLPFASGDIWFFTGGPHGGYGDGSGWAALDFAPPGEAAGCAPSDTWIGAAADGVVAYSAGGLVVQDLDGDGFLQTGWSLVYLHVETRGRVPVGARLAAGDPVGHPSCEGGISTGTHLHLARRYNGEWISADRDLPFDLGGWVSAGTGGVYDGILMKDGQTVEAFDGRSSANQIQR